jgi:peptidoglycan hydrolase CwlO-like protein
VVAGVVALASLPTGAGAQPTQDRVEAIRESIEQVAQEWFATQQEAAALDAEITGLESRIEAAREHATEIAVVARERAVQIYKGSGAVSPVPDGGDALESARRVELLDRANAQSHRAIDELTAATEELDARLEELEARREEHAEVAARLAGQRAELQERLEVLRERAAEEASARQRRQALTSRRSAAAPVGSSSAPARRQAPTTRDAPSAAAPPAPASTATHPQHDHPFLVCTRARESGGNYRAVNHSGGWYGAYQFAQSTWDVTAARAGRDDLIGVNPVDASPYDQDELAWTLYQWQGNRPWGGRC